MYGSLRIEGDPTIWVLAQPTAVNPLSEADATVTIDVSSPLAGTLLLVRKSVASLVLFEGPGGGIGPTDGPILQTPALYLPSSTGLTGGSPVYALPPATNLAELAAGITDAITSGAPFPVQFGNAESSGLLVLNGEAVPFVLLCPASSVLDEPSGVGGIGPTD
jgi:hypothetical protein